MNHHSIHHDTLLRERIHRAKVIKKLEKIQGLQALLEMWESHPNPDPDYIHALHNRLRAAQIQYLAMQP
jgi:hypothetical protein